MSKLMTIESDVALMVSEMKRRRAEESEMATMQKYMKQAAKLNKVTADLARARRQNTELLRMIDKMTGYHSRLSLPVRM